MRSLIVALFFCIGASAWAEGRVFYYSDISNIKGRQLIIDSSTVGSHFVIKLSTCEKYSGYICFNSDALKFAIPVDSTKSKWVYSGARYRITNRAEMMIFGNKVNAYWIEGDDRGTKRIFVFSREKGLLSISTKTPPGATFVLENGCGFGADENCKE